MTHISQAIPSPRVTLAARALRPVRLAGAAGRDGAAVCGCTDPDSSPGRLAPVAAVAALGPDSPDYGPLADLGPTYGPRPGPVQASAPPKGFFLDRYVY